MKVPGPWDPKERGEGVPASSAMSDRDGPTNQTTMDHDAAPKSQGGELRVEPPSLLDVLRPLSRWWLFILRFAAVGSVFGFLLTVGVMPVYQARTSLYIPSIGGGPESGDSGGSSSESNIETQIKLVQSTTVLGRTVARLQSEAHPPFLDRGDLISKLATAVGLSRGNDLAYSDLVEDAGRRVRVEPVDRTRLVEVTCESWDAGLSTRFCNVLTEEFAAVDLEARKTEAQKTSSFLVLQVADVRQKVEDSEKKLAAANRGGGSGLSLQTNAAGEDRLHQLQDELALAQADRMEKESLLRRVTAAAANAIPESPDTPVFRAYQQRLAELNAMVAKLVPPLSEQNPNVVHLRAQIREVKDAMARERSATVARARNDFASARHHEDLLNETYATLQASLSGKMGQPERVTLLRRELESEQQLYETLLGRMKEAAQASSRQTTAIRVVDAAMVPKSPVSPRRGLATLVGLLFGSLSGLGFAFYKERAANVFRMPGEAERVLHVQELGVIPSAALSDRPQPTTLSTASNVADLSKGMGQSPAILFWNERFSIGAEAYRNASHSILSAGAQGRSRAYVITSPGNGEGKTTITTNLGIAFSKSKLRVVMVDANLRNPSLHKNLLVKNGWDLRSLLRAGIEIAAAPLPEFCSPTRIPNLWLIPAGQGEEEETDLLHSSALTTLLSRLARGFDVVLIDTPPMLPMADARILAAHTDGVLLVLRAGVTRREAAAHACRLLASDHVPLMGTILNDFNPAHHGKKDYYQSYYEYWERIESAEKSGLDR